MSSVLRARAGDHTITASSLDRSPRHVTNGTRRIRASRHARSRAPRWAVSWGADRPGARVSHPACGLRRRGFRCAPPTRAAWLRPLVEARGTTWRGRERQPRVSDHVRRQGQARRIAEDVRAVVGHRRSGGGAVVMGGGVPPRFSTAVLRVLLPEAIRDEALDELRDGYLLRVAQDGRDAADRWYRRQVPAFAIRVRLAILTGGSLVPPTALHLHEPSLTGSERMTTILADLRYGARAMVRNPAFSAIAVLTLALGIGANAAIFSVVRTVLLRPLPFSEPDRLVQVWESRRDRGWTQTSFTHANFWDVQDMNQSFSAMGAITYGSINLAGKDNPEMLSVAYVTTGFLRGLGVTPVAGRVFADGEDRVGADQRIVILSHRLWTTQFGSDRSIVGRDVTLSGQAYHVIGVLPPGTPWLDAG